MVKLGKRGQLSIPKSVLSRLGLEGEVPLLVETTEDGAILLRPAGVYPIEIYSDERIEEFDAGDRMDSAVKDRLSRALAATE
jgi:AbrB family looped-hinge helix DNA binding protein